MTVSLLLGTSSATAATQKDLSKVGSQAATAASQSHVSPKIKRMQRHTNMWRAMADKYARGLGFTLSWTPLSDSYGKLKHQEHAARFGCRYWHHRHRKMVLLSRDTRHLRRMTQKYAHVTHPHRQYSWTWTPRSLHPSLAKKQHRKATGAFVFWRHRLRSIDRPTTTQVPYMICSYTDWGCAVPVRVATCESGLVYWKKNPSSSARGIFQILGGSTNGGVNIRVAHRMWLSRNWEPWTASEHCWG